MFRLYSRTVHPSVCFLFFFKVLGLFSPLDLLCSTHPEGHTGETPAQNVFDKNDLNVEVCFHSLFQGLCDVLDIFSTDGGGVYVKNIPFCCWWWGFCGSAGFHVIIFTLQKIDSYFGFGFSLKTSAHWPFFTCTQHRLLKGCTSFIH